MPSSVFQGQHDDPTNGIARKPVASELLDSEEAAALMKVHPKTLQKLARRGELKGIHRRQTVALPRNGHCRLDTETGRELILKTFDLCPV